MCSSGSFLRNKGKRGGLSNGCSEFPSVHSSYIGRRTHILRWEHYGEWFVSADNNIRRKCKSDETQIYCPFTAACCLESLTDMCLVQFPWSLEAMIRPPWLWLARLPTFPARPFMLNRSNVPIQYIGPSSAPTDCSGDRNMAQNEWSMVAARREAVRWLCPHMMMVSWLGSPKLAEYLIYQPLGGCAANRSSLGIPFNVQLHYESLNFDRPARGSFDNFLDIFTWRFGEVTTLVSMDSRCVIFPDLVGITSHMLRW